MFEEVFCTVVKYERLGPDIVTQIRINADPDLQP
jgi:hypothetical protein